MAKRLRQYLDQRGVPYELLTRPNSDRLPVRAPAPTQTAKSVILGDSGGYLMAVVPATHEVDLEFLRRYIGRDLNPARLDDVQRIFNDCQPGAIPPIGEAYDMNILLDEALFDWPDIYFHAGRVSDLVHMRGHDFREMMHGVAHGFFSHPAEPFRHRRSA